MSRYKEIDISKLKRYQVKDRHSKVDGSLFAKNGSPGLSEFWSLTPDILKAKDMKELLNICKNAVTTGKPIYLGLGGHVIKCGLAPLIIELMKMGAIKGIAANGSVIIHDYEIAMYGKTSEDVAAGLEASDTADGINGIISRAKAAGLGLGEAVGKAMSETALHQDLSLLANAYKCGVPVTVHVAVGTDIIHQHPSADGAALGETSLRDFRIFCHNLIELNGGGVFLNFGSSVIIPEVFLKAVAVVRNLGFPLKDFTTAVFDMNTNYRPLVNVTQRPVASGGRGYYFIGHHEIMIPLFLLSLREKLNQ
jgi:hypothetical protein